MYLPVFGPCTFVICSWRWPRYRLHEPALLKLLESPGEVGHEKCCRSAPDERSGTREAQERNRSLADHRQAARRGKAAAGGANATEIREGRPAPVARLRPFSISFLRRFLPASPCAYPSHGRCLGRKPDTILNQFIVARFSREWK